ncbi:hypothetical protein ABMA57_14815 [Saccharospirillum sp. HFRX-1]|uniref:hypothetical protein n=1 Tax=unclassified Saccharospirillum TaxID=2633430 RepID=UPI00371DEA87
MDLPHTLSIFIKSLAVLGLLAIFVRLLNSHRSERNDEQQATNEMQPPTAPSLELHFKSARRLHFAWQEVRGATHYQLLERPGPNSLYRPVGRSVPAGNGQLIVKTPLHSRLNSQYVLRAYNDVGLADSVALSVSERLETKLAFLLNGGIDPTGYFGFSINKSAGGRTMIIAEDDAKDGATNASAYVFLRDGDDQWNKLAYLRGDRAAAMSEDELEAECLDISVTPAEPIKTSVGVSEKGWTSPLSLYRPNALRDLRWLNFNSP